MAGELKTRARADVDMSVAARNPHRNQRKARARAYLDLVRIPNLFTAQADVLAGSLFAGATWEDGPILLLLMVASSCLYAGGVVLNDVCDAASDARDRPDRPIPSGRVSRHRAMRLACLLLGAGVALAAFASFRSALTAGAIVVVVVLYDTLGKRTAIAPVLMGTCRALNLLLGTLVAAVLPFEQVAAPLAIMGLYITSVTYFAGTEAGVSDPGRLKTGTLGVLFAVAGLVVLYGLVPHVHAGYLGLAALFGVVVVRWAAAAVADPQPIRVQHAVRGFVLSIIVLDACIAWSVRGLWAAAIVAVLLVPCMVLGRRFRVT